MLTVSRFMGSPFTCILVAALHFCAVKLRSGATAANPQAAILAAVAVHRAAASVQRTRLRRMQDPGRRVFGSRAHSSPSTAQCVPSHSAVAPLAAIPAQALSASMLTSFSLKNYRTAWVSSLTFHFSCRRPSHLAPAAGSQHPRR